MLCWFYFHFRILLASVTLSRTRLQKTRLPVTAGLSVPAAALIFVPRAMLARNTGARYQRSGACKIGQLGHLTVIVVCSQSSYLLLVWNLENSEGNIGFILILLYLIGKTYFHKLLKYILTDLGTWIVSYENNNNENLQSANPVKNRA